MKTLYISLTLLFLIFSNLIHGQSNTLARHVYDEGVHSLVSQNGLHYYIEEVYTRGFIDTMSVVCVNSNNVVKFKKQISVYYPFTNFAFEWTPIKKMGFSMDNQLVICGGATGCDYISPSAQFFFSKVDTNGTISFMTTVSSPTSTNFGAGFDTYCQLLDSSYVVFADKGAYRFSKSGVFTSSVSTTYTGCTESYRTPANEILLVANDNLYKLDANLNQLSSLYLGVSPTQLFKSSSGDYYFGMNNSLGRINQALTNLTAASYIGNTFTGISFYNDTIYACGKNNFANSSIFIFNAALSLLNQNTTSYPNLAYEGISVNASHIRLVGTEKSNNAIFPNSNSFFYKLNKNSSLVLRNDAAITAILKDTAYAVYYPPGLFGPGTVVAHFKAKLEITNYGLDTLKKVNANFILTDFQDFCGKKYYIEGFNNLQIAPQTSQWVTTNWITNSYYSWNSYLPGTIAPSSVCFWTSIPNNNSDKNHLNDVFCGNMNAIVLGEESTLASIQNNDIQIFPNPTSDKLQVLLKNSNVELKRIWLYNLDGKLITTQANTQQLDMIDLPAGIYILKVETNKRVFFQKVVKR
jgi:hypothetical protein